MTLVDTLEKLKTTNQKKFITLCVAGMSIEQAQDYISLPSYYRWLRQPVFKEVLDKLPELRKEHGEEAGEMLHIKNMIEAIAIEEKILAIIKEELKTGKYNLIKTHIGREVFTRAEKSLLSKRMAQKQAMEQTWNDRLKEYGLTTPDKEWRKNKGIKEVQ